MLVSILTEKWRGVNRTGLFFAACFLLALVGQAVPNIHAVLAPAVAFIFFRGRYRIIVPAIAGLFMFATSHAVLVVDQRTPGNTPLYQTAGGWLKADAALGIEPGSLVIGAFRTEPFSPTDDVFDNGFLVPVGDVLVSRVPVVSSMLSWRSAMSERLHLLSGMRVRMAQGMILGDRRYIAHETRDMFVKTGTAHLLAVSGMHVGMIVGLILLGFGFLQMKLRIIAALMIVPWYVPVAGFSDTVVRAVLFAVISFIAYIFDHSINYRRFTLWLGGLFLLIGPGALTDISLILSFFAVYGIVTLLQFEESRWRGALLVGVAASAFTLPVSLAVFGTFNPLGVLNTLVLLPFVQAIVGFGIGALALPGVFLSPLMLVESWLHHALSFVHWLTEPFFILDRIGIPLMLVLMAGLAALAVTRCRWWAVLVFLVPLIPAEDQTGAWFAAMQRGRGFISVDADGKSAVYFRGTHSQFVYEMVPFVATAGLKTFDRGHVRVYDGANLFLEIRERVEENEPMGGVCVNAQGDDCRISYWTGASYVPEAADRTSKYHVCWRTDEAGEDIVQLANVGSVRIMDGMIEDIE